MYFQITQPSLKPQTDALTFQMSPWNPGGQPTHRPAKAHVPTSGCQPGPSNCPRSQLNSWIPLLHLS